VRIDPPGSAGSGQLRGNPVPFNVWGYWLASAGWPPDLVVKRPGSITVVSLTAAAKAFRWE
jgi:hypothetical protein